MLETLKADFSVNVGWLLFSWLITMKFSVCTCILGLLATVLAKLKSDSDPIVGDEASRLLRANHISRVTSLSEQKCGLIDVGFKSLLRQKKNPDDVSKADQTGGRLILSHCACMHGAWTSAVK